MEKKLRLRPDEVVAHASSAVERACMTMDEVEFSCEDATRSDPEFVAPVCRAAVEAGATTINLPDTVGYMLPDGVRGVHPARPRELCPELEDVALSAHCHDDLGLAVANSLAAVGAGVDQLECTVNGIGERAGNASLEEIVMAMRVRGDLLQAHTDVDPSQIGRTSRLVERLTGVAVPPNKAIVGANAFAHEAGIHQDGLLKDAATYQIMDPSELDLAMTLPLGKHSGRHAFSRACAEAGLQLGEQELEPRVHPLQGACRRGQRRIHPRALSGGDRAMTTYSIACLAGDGIGPEVMAQASRGMRAAARLHGFAHRRGARAVRRGRDDEGRASVPAAFPGTRRSRRTRSSSRRSTGSSWRRSRRSSICVPRSCASGSRAQRSRSSRRSARTRGSGRSSVR